MADILDNTALIETTPEGVTQLPSTPSAMESVSTVPETMSEAGQEASEAAGTNYSQLGKAAESASEGTAWQSYNPTGVGEGIDSNVDIKSGASYLNQATDTVAGQLDKLLQSDNPYIQQARLAGTEQAAERGMLNTSLAAGAAERSAITAALPIAQQDATTYATASGRQQAADYNMETMQGEAIISGEMVEQKAAIAQKSADIQNSFQAHLAGAGEQSKIQLQDLQNTFNLNIQNLDNQMQTAMQSERLDEEAKARVSQHAAGLVQNYQVSIENMLTDPDFLQLGSEALNANIEQMQAIASNGIDLIAGYESSGDMTGLTEEFLGYGDDAYVGA